MPGTRRLGPQFVIGETPYLSDRTLKNGGAKTLCRQPWQTGLAALFPSTGQIPALWARYPFCPTKGWHMMDEKRRVDGAFRPTNGRDAADLGSGLRPVQPVGYCTRKPPSPIFSLPGHYAMLCRRVMVSTALALDPLSCIPYTTPSATAPDSSGASLLRDADSESGTFGGLYLWPPSGGYYISRATGC